MIKFFSIICIILYLTTQTTANTLCRPETGICDTDDFCSGVEPECPEPVICTDVDKPCKMSSYCDGISPEYPVKSIKSESMDCSNSPGPCDFESICDGTSYTSPIKTERDPNETYESYMEYWNNYYTEQRDMVNGRNEFKEGERWRHLHHSDPIRQRKERELEEKPIYKTFPFNFIILFIIIGLVWKLFWETFWGALCLWVDVSGLAVAHSVNLLISAGYTLYTRIRGRILDVFGSEFQLGNEGFVELVRIPILIIYDIIYIFTYFPYNYVKSLFEECWGNENVGNNEPELIVPVHGQQIPQGYVDLLNQQEQHYQEQEVQQPSVPQLEEEYTPATSTYYYNPECVICMDRTSTVILLPCRHKHLCDHCAAIWFVNNTHCPTCGNSKVPVERILYEQLNGKTQHKKSSKKK